MRSSMFGWIRGNWTLNVLYLAGSVNRFLWDCVEVSLWTSILMVHVTIVGCATGCPEIFDAFLTLHKANSPVPLWSIFLPVSQFVIILLSIYEGNSCLSHNSWSFSRPFMKQILACLTIRNHFLVPLWSKFLPVSIRDHFPVPLWSKFLPVS
jgi:hypothetical protein